MKFPINWDLARFFPDRKGFTHFLHLTEEEIESLPKQSLHDALLLQQSISLKLRQADAYVTCRFAQNVSDTDALVDQDRLSLLSSTFDTYSLAIDEQLKNLSDQDFEELLSLPEFKNITFPLQERKAKSKEKLSIEKESIINDLSIDGYHGWSQLFDSLMGNICVPFEGKDLSFGQIENKLSSPDEKIRKSAFHSLVKPFKKQEMLFAQALNHIAGFRLNLYKQRRWTSFLKEPLEDNRMTIETLNSMWNAITKYKKAFLPYFAKKAELLGKEKLSWYDLEAPLGNSSLEYTYDEASHFIIDNFKRFSPKLAEFSEHALKDGWIEAEDRPGKGPGGFCVEFPIQAETRIFMTYSNTFTNLSTLAHELGHGFHAKICSDLPEMAQHYRMNVAETASTMAEMIVIDAAIEKAKDKKQRLALLDDKIGRSVAFLMNIHARFLFEVSFYEERQKGYVLPEKICALMETAQKTAYLDSLEEYHPYFWAAKLHFYFTKDPFYNFPYTFGYLFSLGIYSRLKKDPAGAEKKYIALLKDSGLMNVEDLAKKHLDVDLEKMDFWEDAVKETVRDVETFIKEV